MLSSILGEIALAITNELVNDEKEKLKDEIQGEVMGFLDELDDIVENELNDLDKFIDNEFDIKPKNRPRPKQNKEFKKLNQLKIDIQTQLLENYNINVIQDEKIKKDKTKNIIITNEMKTNLSGYFYILRTSFTKIEENIKNNKNEDNEKYIELLREILLTKIIIKGELNDNSTQLILKGATILLSKNDNNNKSNLKEENRGENDANSNI